MKGCGATGKPHMDMSISLCCVDFDRHRNGNLQHIDGRRFAVWPLLDRWQRGRSRSEVRRCWCAGAGAEQSGDAGAATNG